MKKLLEVGANPNEKDNWDKATPLIIACENYSDNCDTIIIKWLTDYKGDVNFIQIIDRIENNGAHSVVKTTPLMIAAKNNCLDIVKVLLNSGADINKYTYNEGYGSITESLIQDNLEIANYLIIDSNAKIPEYCFIRNENEENEQKLTITDMLNERHYDLGSNNYKLKEKIITYLKSKTRK